MTQNKKQTEDLRVRCTGAPLKSNSPSLELCLSYLSHAGVGVIAWWLKDGQSYPPEQVAAWLNQLNKETLEYNLGEVGAAKP